MSGESAVQVFHILVVEDNEADVYLLRQALKEAGLGFELTVIDDGAEALDFIGNPAKHGNVPRLDLAILDLNLPKSTGLEVLEAIRCSHDLWNVPVAIVTSSAEPRERAKTDELRVERFITKPPDLEDFLQIGAVLKEMLLESQGPAEIL